MTQMLKLSNKDFKAAIINMLQWTLLETNEIENISKEIEDLQKSQTNGSTQGRVCNLTYNGHLRY